MTEELLERLEARLASPRLTPMMRQYLTVKAEHPEALVLFRMGDFFETFFEDAEECAKRLDITLTARSKERDIPMAGVPHHALDGYLGRLVQQGCTVVLVDQVEDPKQAKGLVKREITRVVTPGTYIDPSAPARTPTYLVALELARSAKKDRWALAALDLSTGELRATAERDEALLLDELTKLGPKEILLLDAQAMDPLMARIHAALPEVLLSRLDARDYGDAAALLAFDDVLGAAERAALEPHLSKMAMVATGRALAYAARTQIRDAAPDLRGRASLRHIGPLRPYIPGDALVLDREAREHLELFRSSRGEKRGSLLQAIDEAATPMGGRLLAEWLAYPARDLAVIRGRQGAVQALASAPAELDKIREGLGAVADVERLVGRIVLGRALPRELLQLAGALEIAPSVLEAAGRAARGAGTLLGGALASAVLAEIAEVDDCSDVRDGILSALSEEASNDLTKEVFRSGYHGELDRLVEVSSKGKRLVEGLEQREKEETGIPSLKVRYNKVFGYYIEVTRTHLSLVPERYIRKQTTVNAERFFTEELKELEDEVLNAEERRASLTEKLYADLLERVAEQAGRLRGLAQALAKLDVLAGLAHLAETQDWTRPEMHDGLEIEIRDGRHPVLEPLAGELGERFVPNDVGLSAEERLMIITGPNMAGKSTIMRQTALIVILAHMGSFVPARLARIGRVGRIFTRVGASDDLSRGRSTFMVEMTETARILRGATHEDLVILDEIGRGTSTFDGLAIAWAVAEHLHDVVRARTLFATHYHEMTELCRDKAHAVNRHVAVREHEDDIVFLRKLVPGATNRSYGVQVARLAGLPPGVLSRARDVLDALEGQALAAGSGSPVEHLVSARKQSRAHGPDQLPLFARPKMEGSVEDGPARKVLERIRALALDDLTPRQALDILAELQGMLPG